MKRTNFLCLLIFAGSVLYAQNTVIQWRNDRTGIYNEHGLLKTWPAEGPQLLWHFDGTGQGNSSVSIESDKIYVTGMGDDRQGFLSVLNLEGKLLHKIQYGLEFDATYPGSRSAIMLNNGKLYIVSGMMELFCFDTQSLKLLWKKNYEKEYEAKNTENGWHGPPLIVGEKLIIAPGGRKYNVVALNKTTGEMIWSSEGAGVMAGYGVPIYIGDQQTPQVAVMMSDYIIGLDITNGKLLWSYPHTDRFKEHPNTPLYYKGMLLCMSSYGKGSVMLRLTNGGKSVEKVWELKELCNQIGGMVKIGDYVYGPGEKTNWYCVDWNTGKIIYADPTLAVGNIIANDGMLYIYTNKGDMALVKPGKQKFEITGKFPITLGTEQHFAHPVIYKGVLYVRHGDTLMAYKIKQ